MRIQRPKEFLASLYYCVMFVFSVVAFSCPHDENFPHVAVMLVNLNRIIRYTCAQLDQWYLDAILLAFHRIRHVGVHTPSIFLILILIMLISGDDLNSLC